MRITTQDILIHIAHSFFFCSFSRRSFISYRIYLILIFSQTTFADTTPLWLLDHKCMTELPFFCIYQISHRLHTVCLPITPIIYHLYRCCTNYRQQIHCTNYLQHRQCTHYIQHRNCTDYSQHKYRPQHGCYCGNCSSKYWHYCTCCWRSPGWSYAVPLHRQALITTQKDPEHQTRENQT